MFDDTFVDVSLKNNNTIYKFGQFLHLKGKNLECKNIRRHQHTLNQNITLYMTVQCK